MRSSAIRTDVLAALEITNSTTARLTAVGYRAVAPHSGAMAVLIAAAVAFAQPQAAHHHHRSDWA
jgi:hypothetical protein